MNNCIFCKIVNKEIPANVIYEDDDILAFYDINPKAPIHFLVIPKLHIESLKSVTYEQINLIGKLMFNTNKIATDMGLEGYKVHINTGVKGGQEVFHLHIHILGSK